MKNNHGRQTIGGLAYTTSSSRSIFGSGERSASREKSYTRLNLKSREDPRVK
jgi:hypothetical protein